MTKTITVRCAPRENHAGWWAARRFFPNGQDKVLEVLDQEEDAEDVLVADSHDPERKDKRPHPTQIGQRSYRHLLAQPLLLVRDGGEVATQAAGPSDADRIAALEQLVADMKAQLDEARAAPGRRSRSKVDALPVDDDGKAE